MRNVQRPRAPDMMVPMPANGAAPDRERPPLGVALVGYGYAGKTFHAPLLDAVPGLRLELVLSRDGDKVHADRPGLRVRRPDECWLDDPAVELVVVATPNDTHFDLARRALEAGKHVVVDKPFTVTAAEARELAALARRRGRILSVFHNRRWDADFLTLRGLVASGALGEVCYLESRFDRYRPQVRERWREAPGPGGGIWYDLGPHLLDQALRLFGPPRALFADLALQRADARAVDYFHVLLRYERLRVVLHGSVLVPGGSPRFVAHGTAASFVKHGLDPQEERLKRGPAGGPGWGHDPVAGALFRAAPQGAPAEDVPNVNGDYLAYYAAVRDAIRDGAPNPVPPEEAAEVVALLELAAESAARGRELPVAPP